VTGTLVVFEGADGVGKTTQLARVAAALAAREPLVLKQPSDFHVGRLIRDTARGNLFISTPDGLPSETWVPGVRAMALLFAADRVDQYERVVRPALHDGRLVLMDRYYHSSMAYQGTALGAGGVREIRAYNAHVPAPDLVVVLEAPLAVAAARRVARGAAAELFEADATQRRVAAFYAELERWCPGEKIARIAGDASVDNVTAAILATLERHGIV